MAAKVEEVMGSLHSQLLTGESTAASTHAETSRPRTHGAAGTEHASMGHALRELKLSPATGFAASALASRLSLA